MPDDARARDHGERERTRRTPVERPGRARRRPESSSPPITAARSASCSTWRWSPRSSATPRRPGPSSARPWPRWRCSKCADARLREHWLPALASGDAVGTVALGEDGGEWDPARLEAEGEERPPHRQQAAWSPTRRSPTCWSSPRTTRRGRACGWSSAARRACEITPLAGNDMTRRLARRDLLEHAGDRDRRRRGAGRVRSTPASCCVAADAYGGCRRCLEMSSAYALQREQFGQVIGAFQAVKHQLANMAADLEPSLSLLWYAAHAFDHIVDQSARHAAIVKAHLTRSLRPRHPRRHRAARRHRLHLGVRPPPVVPPRHLRPQLPRRRQLPPRAARRTWRDGEGAVDGRAQRNA